METLGENERPVPSRAESFAPSPAASPSPARAGSSATRADPDRASGGGLDHVAPPIYQLGEEKRGGRSREGRKKTELLALQK